MSAGRAQQLTRQDGGGTMLHSALGSFWARAGMVKKATPAKRDSTVAFMMVEKSWRDEKGYVRR